MKVIFIAGPFRDKTPWDVECNIRRAETLALEVAKLGAMPLCPHTNTRFFDKQLTDEFWIRGTSELLKRCDAVVMTHDWRESTGARAERGLADELGIPIFYDEESSDRLKKFIEESDNGNQNR